MTGTAAPASDAGSATAPRRDRQAEIAAALAGGGDAPTGLNDGRGRPAADRFAVYRNNVAVSLVEALSTTYAVSARLAGESFFKAAALAYARSHLPTSPLLFEYGAGFPDFLRSLPGLTRYPFIADVARLEYQRVQSYHAADAPPLPPDALASVAPDALGALVFAAHPASAVMELSAAAYEAFRRETDPTLPHAPTAAAALVTRPHETVLVTPLTAPAASFTRALAGGAPLGEAAQTPALDLAETLATLLRVGAFSRSGPSPHPL